MLLFYKALHGLIDIDIERYIQISTRKLPSDYLTLKMRYARTNILNYSYLHRIVGTWNSLPEYIRRAASVNFFKVLVKKFFMDQ